ncbi:MAG: tryptophan 2,3-dioxygenase family protein [Bacteroidota bacterium]|nr:tryptophan 2,3-dioxygenase family protein [Bacteroidota bacterium]
MSNQELDPQVVQKIKLLEAKYAASGQDLSTYLEGLLHADYLKYWDYINLETLLSLQRPRTRFPDEVIFIVYHQVTELYLKLMLWEIEQISDSGSLPTPIIFLEKIKRINSYFDYLVNTFDTMFYGMEHEQFLNFRMTLTPSSGFQSLQFRLVEIRSTSMKNLLSLDIRNDVQDESPEALFQKIYWKKGATESSTGKKTLSLVHFEQKYGKILLQNVIDYKEKNLWSVYKSNFSSSENSAEIIQALRTFDQLANVFWPLAHYKSAFRYLRQKSDAVAATGGTNWQMYLPPHYQKVIYFPNLWSQDEKDNWGKQWVDKEVFEKAI